MARMIYPPMALLLALIWSGVAVSGDPNPARLEPSESFPDIPGNRGIEFFYGYWWPTDRQNLKIFGSMRIEPGRFVLGNGQVFPYRVLGKYRNYILLVEDVYDEYAKQGVEALIEMGEAEQARLWNKTGFVVLTLRTNFNYIGEPFPTQATFGTSLRHDSCGYSGLMPDKDSFVWPLPTFFEVLRNSWCLNGLNKILQIGPDDPKSARLGSGWSTSFYQNEAPLSKPPRDWGKCQYCPRPAATDGTQVAR